MRRWYLVVLLSLTFGVTSTAVASAQDLSRDELIARIDSLVTDPIDEGRMAGASVGVVRGADTILLKAYGYADLEYHVPTPDRAIYEIGSVTKQFTAVAILQLVEEGLIDLDRDFTEYLPDYPEETSGITVRRLMDHTSGIKGYTEMAEFGAIAARELPRDSLVAMFSAAQPDFASGEAMIYNNSAYFLLGLIIEAVSGESYEEYVQQHFFDSIEMEDSQYCSSSAIIERRAHGYDTGPDGLVRKGYIDHTWPYAAGSLCSTAWDLVAWNEALHGDGSGGDILSASGYRELITPGSLNDGTPLRYAKGLSVVESGGRNVIGHGGGIPGFLSQVTYYPEEDLSVIVLVNTTGPPGPGPIANGIARLILGDPSETSSSSFSGNAGDLVGTYRGAGRGREFVVTIGYDSDGITAAVGERDPIPLSYVSDYTFRRGNTHYTFVVEAGKVVRLQVDQVSGLYVLSPDP